MWRATCTFAGTIKSTFVPARGRITGRAVPRAVDHRDGEDAKNNGFLCGTRGSTRAMTIRRLRDRFYPDGERKVPRRTRFQMKLDTDRKYGPLGEYDEAFYAVTDDEKKVNEDRVMRGKLPLPGTFDPDDIKDDKLFWKIKKKPRLIRGWVISDKMDKTITVGVPYKYNVRRYNIQRTRISKIMAHDEYNEYCVGDLLALISAGRKLSKRKSHFVYEVLRKTGRVEDPKVIAARERQQAEAARKAVAEAEIARKAAAEAEIGREATAADAGHQVKNAPPSPRGP